jgi:glycosyltransferase involved in cell wall biosynthesis
MMSVNAAWNIAHFRRPVVRALSDRGHRLTALAPADDAVPALEGAGVRHLHLEMDNRGLNPVRDTGLALRLHRHFRAHAPDVILSWTIKNNIFGALAARQRAIPFIPNVSGLGTAFLSGRVVQTVAETLYRTAFRGLDTVFFQNEEDRDLFLSRRLTTPAQSHLLPGSGIDLAHFAAAPLPDGPPVFLLIARLLRDKGVGEFVDAARMIRARHPQARFRLLGAAGADNRSAFDRATLDGWVAEGVVEYLGTTDDVRPAIAAATCIVLPSYREGAPRALIEGAAMARPLIATDVPGCRQVVDNGRSGFLCRAQDAADLAATIERFLALPHAAQAAMGAAGRARMERDYDERHVVAAYLAAIDRATGGRA